MKKILVPIDGSEGAMLALKKAREVGEAFDSDLILISVFPDAQIGRFDEESRALCDEINNERIKRSKQILSDGVAFLKDYKGNVETIHQLGNIASEIVRYANENNMDLIVIGNRGSGAFSRTFLGSVSDKVMNMSRSSVLVVKE